MSKLTKEITLGNERRNSRLRRKYPCMMSNVTIVSTQTFARQIF